MGLARRFRNRRADRGRGHVATTFLDSRSASGACGDTFGFIRNRTLVLDLGAGCRRVYRRIGFLEFRGLDPNLPPACKKAKPSTKGLASSFAHHPQPSPDTLPL